MRVIKQVRYFDTGDSRNSLAVDGAESVNSTTLSNGNAFLLNGYSIVQLGIQTMPGVQFTLNGGTSSIAVGQTGIYELELNDAVSINRLQFYGSSISMIEKNSYAYLIVDLIYESNT